MGVMPKYSNPDGKAAWTAYAGGEVAAPGKLAGGGMVE